MKSLGKSVLITGCDTGFGNELAKRLDYLGFTVYATVLNPDGDGPKNLQKECSDNVKIMKMDVTESGDVQNVVETIKRSGDTLWAVVNNAGIAAASAIEFGNDCDLINKIINVNLLGVIRVTKQCLPLLRQSKGRVINMSSVAGRVSVPGMSGYCIAKHGVRSFSDCMRREMKHYGIDVITIEPHLYRTPMTDPKFIIESLRKEWDDTPNDMKTAFGGDKSLKSRIKIAKFVCKTARNKSTEVIDALIDSVIFERPKIYYRVAGPLQTISVWIFERMPESVQDLCFNFLIKLNLK